MPFYPTNLKDWVDVITKALATLFALIGGGWGLYQYFRSTKIRAAETLLKLEEEFRNVFSTYEEIEDIESYKSIVKPVLDAQLEGKLGEADLKKLTQIDRCLRFLYLCSVLNEVLGVDRALGVKGGALHRAYYYYLGILLPEEREQRPELLAYTDSYYPKLTMWIRRHAGDLSAARTLGQRSMPANQPLRPPGSTGG